MAKDWFPPEVLYLDYIHCRLVREGRPDNYVRMTSADDWALKANYLSIVREENMAAGT